MQQMRGESGTEFVPGRSPKRSLLPASLLTLLPHTFFGAVILSHKISTVTHLSKGQYFHAEVRDKGRYQLDTFSKSCDNASTMEPRRPGYVTRVQHRLF